MAKLTHTFEKVDKKTHQLQVLEISAIANSRDEAENLNYNDFKIDLFINHKHIADIGPVLATTDVYKDLVISIDWVSIYHQEVISNPEPELV